MTKKKKTKKKTKRVMPTKTKKKKTAATRSTSKKKKTKVKKTRSNSEPLRLQREAFCREYVIDFKPCAACMRTNPEYSMKVAAAMASRWLGRDDVSEFIAKLIKKREERLDLKADEAMIECRRIALADVADAFDEDGSIKAIHDIPLDLRRCISGLEIEDIWEGKGKDKVYIGRLVKIKFWSKDKNLEMLFKHHGLFEKDNKQVEKRGTVLIINRPSK